VLAVRRLRARLAQALVVALGFVVGAALVATAVAGSTAVRDGAVERELARLGPSRTSIQAVWSGVPAQSDAAPATLDKQAKSALREIVGRAPFTVVLFRQARFGGAFVSLGGVDGLARWVTLREGRLPRPCSPTRCELVRVGGFGELPRTPLLPVVGRAALSPAAPLAAYFGDRGHGAPPILIANGALAVGRLPIPDADLIARTIGWVLPIAPGAIHDWQIDDVMRGVAVASAELRAKDPIFSISAPLEELGDVDRRASVAGSRLLVIGGVAAVLVAAFAAFAATRLRPESEAAWQRLTWNGALRAQLLTVSIVESMLVAAAAVLLGWLVGAACGAVFAGALGADAAAVISHSIFGVRALATVSIVAVASAVLLVLALHARPRQLAAFDVAAAGAVLAVALALARGDASPSSVGRGTDTVLLLLPGLVLFAAAVAGARLLRPLLVLAGRHAHRAPPAARLALLSLSRRSGGAVLAVAFLVVAFGAAIFASAYRSTLERGQRDQAAFSVPADYVLSEDLQRLVTTQAANADYARLGHAFDVLRTSGEVPQGPAFTLVAAPAHEIESFAGWRSDFSRLRPDEIARALAARRRDALRGIDLGSGARTLELGLRIRGEPFALALNIRNTRGDFSVLSLGEQSAGARVVRRRLPRVARGGRLVGVSIAFPPVAAFLAGHVESGTTRSVANSSRGTIEFTQLSAGGRELPPFEDWIGTGGVRPLGAGSGIRYLVNRSTESSFRPRQPTDGRAVPVVVTPRLARLASAAGELPLEIHGEPVTGRVVGITRFVPSVPDEGVLADLETMTTALNTGTPGSAVPDEVWVRDPKRGAAALVRERPFSLLAVESRAEVERFVREDPLARGTLWILIVTAVVALLLALAAIVLTAVSDRRDESGRLFDLRVQGAPRRTRRSYVRLRALAVGAAGVVGGGVAGALLLGLVTAFVAVTAGGVEPVPPLVRRLDAPLLVGALVAFAAVAAVAVAAVTREPG